MFKKVLILGMLSISLFITGCAKVVSQEVFEDNVVIEDSYYKSSWIQPIICGKVTTMITHPAEYKIYIRYGEGRITIDDENIYELYKDKKGETVKATFIKKIYDDGSVRTVFSELIN